MTDQEFEDMWNKGKEHDRQEREEWLAKSKQERDQIKERTRGFRSWENLTDEEPTAPSDERPTDR